MCLNCENKGYNYRFKINSRGYGSKFDSEDIEILLCADCINKLNLKREWFDNKCNEDGFYEHEDELEALIDKIGLDKVLLTNKCSSSIITLR